MANEEHLRIVRAGEDAIVEWREENPEVRLDLRLANLRRADLRNADLRNANLSDANLSDANLSDADLSGANLSRAELRLANLRLANLSFANLSFANLGDADLSSADLSGADLSSADLSGADLSYADLSYAGLSYADLSGADLSGATIGWTNFSNVTLENATLTDLKSQTRSTVEGQTFTNMNGVPTKEFAEFLRVCGLERWEIDSARLYDKALTAGEVADIQYRIFDQVTSGVLKLGGVFISYSHKNKRIVDKIYNGFREKDITVYLDRHDFVGGALEKNISRAIEMNDFVVLVLSKASLDSDWVWLEIDKALKKEKEAGNRKKTILFPIAVDKTWWKEEVPNKARLMLKIQERNVLDFSKKEDFDTNLDKLIRGIKIEQDEQRKQD